VGVTEAVAVEHQDLPPQAAPWQLLEDGVTVMDDQAPLSGRDRHRYPLTDQAPPAGELPQARGPAVVGLDEATSTPARTWSGRRH
jgi:hypothetical protein